MGTQANGMTQLVHFSEGRHHRYGRDANQRAFEAF